MASIKSAIRNAVNKSQERYIVKSVHLSKMEDPQTLGGHHTVWVELSVTPRKPNNPWRIKSNSGVL